MTEHHRPAGMTPQSLHLELQGVLMSSCSRRMIDGIMSTTLGQRLFCRFRNASPQKLRETFVVLRSFGQDFKDVLFPPVRSQSEPGRRFFPPVPQAPIGSAKTS